jgi:hypothetical protein
MRGNHQSIASDKTTAIDANVNSSNLLKIDIGRNINRESIVTAPA